MNENQKRCFNLIEVSPNATFDEAKAAYRQLVQVWHPDKHAHNEKLQAKATGKIKEINAAWIEVEAYFKNGGAQAAETERQTQQERERKRRAAQEKSRSESNNQSKNDGRKQFAHITCPFCGVSNRIPAEISIQNASCGECGQILVNGKSDDNNSDSESMRTNNKAWRKQKRKEWQEREDNETPEEKSRRMMEEVERINERTRLLQEETRRIEENTRRMQEETRRINASTAAQSSVLFRPLQQQSVGENIFRGLIGGIILISILKGCG